MVTIAATMFVGYFVLIVSIQVIGFLIEILGRRGRARVCKKPTERRYPLDSACW